ncbi:hypothetical protein E0Z10_g2289 [Xylaria hypoxylon]|uniref:Protein kinase domain-containing protein n=1 Tax=Xylaria hypoxylon TaxID=37992 RepID=A0A4Z0Z4J0_9PEZI|nr:hypothetical protein E0Z10_g2289 [Xylaria hypoxylon]
MMVKYSHGQFSTDPYSDADADVRREYSWLQELRGTEHIVQLAHLENSSPWAPGISRGDDTYEAAVDRAMLEEQARGGWVPKPRRCPTFAVEYLPNGSLGDFVERIRQARQFVPNRLQWRIWLCLVRQCVAMAFPPNIPDEEYIPGTKRREVIRPNKEYYELTHNSAHLKNWVWGEVQPVADMELTDFSRGKLENPDRYPQLDNPSECGSRINLFNAAYVMREICCPRDEYTDLQLSGNPQPYFYTKDGQVFSVETNAPGPLRYSGMMDLELRDILVRCLAEKLQDVPSLEEVLEVTEWAVANRRRNQNPELSDRMGVYEEDGYIRWMIQEYVFDAR